MVPAPDRPQWSIAMPAGGWGPPWPQAVELVGAISGDRWTLIGGLMVQLHVAHAGLDIQRATTDVDMILHIDTGAITFPAAREALEGLGYGIELPLGKGNPVHRFTRGDDRVDVMVADHLAPAHVPKVGGHTLFQVPAGTSALRKTVNCTIERQGESSVTFSIPDVLGALVLKSAAYREDSRDRDRHLDDAALLACTVQDPSREAERLESGSDRGRIQLLARDLEDASHRSWQLVPEEIREYGRHVLAIMSRDPSPTQQPRRMGRTKATHSDES
jgi:hypothetical protein